MLSRNIRISLLFILSILSVVDMVGKRAEFVNDSLLRVLDNRVNNRRLYVEQKQKHLLDLRRNYKAASTPESRFYAILDLFNEYKSFAMDTTLDLAREARALAGRIPGNDTILWRSMLMLSEAEKGYGNYYRALLILDSIPRRAHNVMRNDIISRYCSVYYSLSESSDNQFHWQQKLLAYRDTLSREAESETSRFMNLLELMKLRLEYKKALDLYEEYYNSQTANGREVDNAIRYAGGLLYLLNGDTLQAINLMTRVAINDMEDGVRKYTSLPNIAKILYEQGDYDRAYNYIITSLEDARNSKAQSRMGKVMEYLPIISHAHEAQKMKEARYRLVYTIGAIVLGLVLVLAAGALYLQHKNLKREHKYLSDSHKELSRMKRDLDDLNAKLSVDNQTKEEYIVRLFNLCHEYISIINSHHNTLVKMIRGGANMKQVEKSIGTLAVSGEMGDFFKKFDETILAIFPDFIKRFNRLLKPEFRGDPEAASLTPEQRIYALVRLGMDDSTKIAVFLHYSPQTVYNYRFRAR